MTASALLAFARGLALRGSCPRAPVPRAQDGTLPLPLLPADAEEIAPGVGLQRQDDDGGVAWAHGLATFAWDTGDEAARKLAAVQLGAPPSSPLGVGPMSGRPGSDRLSWGLTRPMSANMAATPTPIPDEAPVTTATRSIGALMCRPPLRL